MDKLGLLRKTVDPDNVIGLTGGLRIRSVRCNLLARHVVREDVRLGDGK